MSLNRCYQKIQLSFKFEYDEVYLGEVNTAKKYLFTKNKENQNEGN